ncbi:MAG TPA: hypothetical protein VL424_20070 [Pararobbsia sp.]|nr:hypothetical protein [Pararobbsia sp.]
MASSSMGVQYSDRKRAQIQQDEAARLEKLQNMCVALDTRTSKWRFPPQSAALARPVKESID